MQTILRCSPWSSSAVRSGSTAPQKGTASAIAPVRFCSLSPGLTSAVCVCVQGLPAGESARQRAGVGEQGRVCEDGPHTQGPALGPPQRAGGGGGGEPAPALPRRSSQYVHH